MTLPDGPDDYWTKTTSPDGAHVWVVSPWDVKMSHWIMQGALWRASPEAKLFEPPSDWSFENRTWPSNDVLRLEGRRYPGRLPGITLTLEVRAERGTLETENLAKLQSAGSYARVKPDEVPVPPVGPQPFDALLRWLEAFPKN